MPLYAHPSGERQLVDRGSPAEVALIASGSGWVLVTDPAEQPPPEPEPELAPAEPGPEGTPEPPADPPAKPTKRPRAPRRKD
ncbi:hypothetical protein [Actinomycetospora aeridis]|uniref:Uncharacterized protein n=1 Tax=Actinomycetospora aeridis TaxID=3129231 RepID=A0ABU8N191_9PSEU